VRRPGTPAHGPRPYLRWSAESTVLDRASYHRVSRRASKDSNLGEPARSLIHTGTPAIPAQFPGVG